jgi:dihydrofolate reductase
MRRLINSTYISMDGVIEEPQNWTFSFRSADAAEYAHDLLFGVDAVLMGRRTYESFAAVWPTLTDETGMADRMNAMPKYVASDSLTEPAWANTTVCGIAGFPGVVRELKEQSGQDIVQYGFGPVTAALIDAGLLDEVRLWVHPLFVGTSEPAALISQHTAEREFALADVRRFESGVVVLSYLTGTGPRAHPSGTTQSGTPPRIITS